MIDHLAIIPLQNVALNRGDAIRSIAKRRFLSWSWSMRPEQY